jgi:hypothetical protein
VRLPESRLLGAFFALLRLVLLPVMPLLRGYVRIALPIASELVTPRRSVIACLELAALCVLV